MRKIFRAAVFALGAWFISTATGQQVLPQEELDMAAYWGDVSFRIGMPFCSRHVWSPLSNYKAKYERWRRQHVASIRRGEALAKANPAAQQRQLQQYEELAKNEPHMKEVCPVMGSLLDDMDKAKPAAK